MRRDEPPGPDDGIGPGDWNSGPWGPAEELPGSAEDASAAIAALREEIRRAESGRAEIGRAEAGQEAGRAGRRRQGRGGRRGDPAGLGERTARGEQAAPGDWAGLGEQAAPGDRAGLGERGAPRGRGKRGRSGGWLPDGPQEGTAAGEGPPADPEAVARAICLRLLTMAPKTRAQLADALRKRDVPEEAANAVLERFSEVGLIDDEAFAAAWVSSRHTGRGLARRALAQELRRRGVAEETVKDAVGRLDPDEEAETARRLVDRKLAATRGVEPQARMRRLVGMLARKGYSPGLAFRVVREAIEAEGSPSDGLPDTFE
ncbi:RecX family transcriptional regulator [Microbispora catharanthi]|uniref:Regulatory protein RecX n=1 Tax=Microbispora catharanthi TaxID=1712871 RepID=A0A5N6BSU4_9ACTN|nr:RecX family transcriptional regulator [Microbispora catharanthi]